MAVEEPQEPQMHCRTQSEENLGQMSQGFEIRRTTSVGTAEKENGKEVACYQGH